MAKKIDPKISALIESLKEPARLALLALVSYLITVIIPQLDFKFAPVILFLLRWLDSYLHETGKAIDSDVLLKGLTRF